MRQTVRRVLRENAKLKSSKQELIEAVYRAAHDAASALTMPAVPLPRKDARKKSGEIALCVMSDWQLAKVTPDYSSEVCEARIAAYADKVRRLTEIQRADHPVKECRVYLLGDLVEGEQIFPGQAWRVDASLFQQTMETGPRILGSLLRSLAATFERVRVVGVIGNHGQIGGRGWKDVHPETNADSFLYEATRIYLQAESRIEWAPVITRGERHWYATDKVGSKNILMFHGNQVKGYAGVPWYGFDRKVKGYALMLERFFGEQRIDYALSGHFHTPFREYINGVTHWGGGSTESMNTYAAEQLASGGEPCQWLLFAHPEEGVTAEYLVHLGR